MPVDPARDRVPFAATAYREIELEPVLIANRAEPSGLTATQHGAVWLSANGEPAMALRAPFAATV
jgi:hypothetical protein